MGAIGEDIALLAIKRNGTLVAYELLHFALAGSQLVQLAEARRIEIDHYDRVVVLDASPTGDALADCALAALTNLNRPPWVKEWVTRQRLVLVDKYLDRFAADGTIRAKDRRALGLFRGDPRWVVVDAGRVSDVKARLAAIAATTGPVTSQQAAFAGLVQVVGLDVWLYPQRKDLATRNRLAAIAEQHSTVVAVSDAPASFSSVVDASGYAAANDAIEVAAWRAVHSSVNAARYAVAQNQQAGQHHVDVATHSGRGDGVDSGPHYGDVIVDTGHHHHHGGSNQWIGPGSSN